MLLPALNHAREVAKSSSCCNRLKQLTTASYIYIDSYSEMMPNPYNPNAADSKPFWGQVLDNEKLINKNIAYCPTMKASPYYNDYFRWWSTYGLYSTGYWSSKTGWNFKKNSRIYQPTVTGFIGDSGLPTAVSGSEDFMSHIIYADAANYNTGLIRLRHQNRANIAMLDGHVERTSRYDVRNNGGLVNTGARIYKYVDQYGVRFRTYDHTAN
jgi:prepilin-type processing-associated H-X9-DG protein